MSSIFNRLLQRRARTQCGQRLGQSRRIPLHPPRAFPRARNGGFGNAAVGGFARLCRARLRQADLHITHFARERHPALHQSGALGIEPHYLSRQRLALAIERGNAVGGFLAQLILLRAVAVNLRALPLDLGHSRNQGAMFAGKRCEFLRNRARRIAQFLRFYAFGCERLHRFGLIGRRRLLALLRFPHRLLGSLSLGLGLVCCRSRITPARENHPPFGDADLLGEPGIAFRRARLSAQRSGAIVHILQNIGKPREIGFGRAQFLFGILAPHMKPRNPCRFFEHLPPFLRLGGDDGSDFALADEGRAMRAGRGIGKDERDILGPHILAIRAIGRACAAFYAPNDFQFILGCRIEHARRRMAFHIGDDRDFGKIARGPCRRACENHIFHAAPAHGFGRALAHHPADRFQKIGFAAAIGTDNAGEAAFDAQLGRLDKTFEARQAQFF